MKANRKASPSRLPRWQAACPPPHASGQHNRSRTRPAGRARRPRQHTGLTLLSSAATGANTATSLQILAAALRPTAPHLIALLLRIAQQIHDGYTAEQAAANYTTKPEPASLAELASAESQLANGALTEQALHEITF